jgi:hypothetical protein
LRAGGLCTSGRFVEDKWSNFSVRHLGAGTADGHPSSRHQNPRPAFGQSSTTILGQETSCIGGDEKGIGVQAIEHSSGTTADRQQSGWNPLGRRGYFLTRGEVARDHAEPRLSRRYSHQGDRRT